MKKRDVGLDIVRIFAYLFVVNVHAYLYDGFGDAAIKGIAMYVLVFFRVLFGTDVPLFLLLTGYLQCEKQVDFTEKGSMRAYLQRCSYVFLTYALCAVSVTVFSRFYLGDQMDVWEMLLNPFSFRQYGWYVNMYLGLYLLIPFLNVLWKNLASRRGHRILIASLLVLTMLPTAVNVLARPWRYGGETKIVPDYWLRLAPITLYYLGAYLRTYVKKSRLYEQRRTVIVVFLLSLRGFTVFTILFARMTTTYYTGQWNDTFGWQNVLNALLFFLVIQSIAWREPGRIGGKVLKLVSELTFGAYLLSWIPNHMVYRILFLRVPDGTARLLYAPIAAAASAVISLGCAFIIHCIVRLFENRVVKCWNRKKAG